MPRFMCVRKQILAGSGRINRGHHTKIQYNSHFLRSHHDYLAFFKIYYGVILSEEINPVNSYHICLSKNPK